MPNLDDRPRAQEGHQMDTGHIPKTFTRGFSEIITNQLDWRAIHFRRFEMRKCSHGEHGVTKFHRTRDDLDGLAVTPYQMHAH